jgi:diguanylate cyclase (GGDEF)-like protein
MSDVVERLAELTGFRDRELLDVTLVGALRDLIAPRSVAIYRSVGEEGNERWVTRAHLTAGALAATADPAWIDIETLPRLSDDPARCDAFKRQSVVRVAGSPYRTIFPLVTDREALGVIEVETDLPLGDTEQRVVMSILRIYRNFLGLLDYSERDTLTGLLNRKTFDESFLQAANDPTTDVWRDVVEDRRAPGPSSAYWLGVIDIDHFKRVNDQHGHLIGDEVLLLLARIMRSCFRFNDRLYRFGGEEFVVLMRCVDSAAASIAFERLRGHVERFAFPQAGSITVSIGVTELRAGDTPSGAFERADKAVYFAKGNGRNQVRHHADLVASGAVVDATKVGDVELF